MGESSGYEELFADVRAVLQPLVAEVRQHDEQFDVFLLGGWSRGIPYASGPTEVLALLAAEQRYLVEQVGRGSVRGDTYLDNAEERLRRWNESRT